VYKLKIREEEVQEMDINPEGTTGLDIIQIDSYSKTEASAVEVT
jgi:hypothetical protein